MAQSVLPISSQNSTRIRRFTVTLLMDVEGSKAPIILSKLNAVTSQRTNFQLSFSRSNIVLEPH